MKNSFLFLGTGASTGIPVAGCRCGVCASPSPYNKRLRPSGMVRFQKKIFLIDVGPDFRQQALLYKIDRIDGLLITHTHYDHIAGIDDLRPFFEKGNPMPCLLSQSSFDVLQQRYQYLFSSRYFAWRIAEEGDLELAGIPLTCFHYEQSKMVVTGFRFGDFAYVSDIRTYTDEIFTALRGVKKLVVSALRHESSQAHFSLSEAVEFAERVGAYRTWLTHISHHLDHEATEQTLPERVRMGYDGLVLEF
jgi:phosphoribosyl 1,2-cyclic phosphate phosphodiesterase